MEETDQLIIYCILSKDITYAEYRDMCIELNATPLHRVEIGFEISPLRNVRLSCGEFPRYRTLHPEYTDNWRNELNSQEVLIPSNKRYTCDAVGNVYCVTYKPPNKSCRHKVKKINVIKEFMKLKAESAKFYKLDFRAYDEEVWNREQLDPIFNILRRHGFMFQPVTEQLSDLDKYYYDGEYVNDDGELTYVVRIAHYDSEMNKLYIRINAGKHYLTDKDMLDAVFY